MFLTKKTSQKKPLKKILTKYSIFFLSILKKVYPTLPLNMKRVGLFCLASLVWHRDWLRQNLHARHPLFYSTLFSTNLIDDLGPFVACHLHRSGDKLTVTGIPVHTSILIHVKDMTQRMENIPEALQAVTTNVTQSVVYELETRALQSQSVTPEVCRLYSIHWKPILSKGSTDSLKHQRQFPPQLHQTRTVSTYSRGVEPSTHFRLDFPFQKGDQQLLFPTGCWAHREIELHHSPE